MSCRYMIFTQDGILQITDPINFPLRIIGAWFEDVFIMLLFFKNV